MTYKTRLLPLIAAGIILCPVFSFGQDGRIPASQMKKMHRETMDDSYLPNAYNNQKVSPAYKYIGNGVSKLSVNSSTITTIQVNVNSNGQNILGDAANEPNIAVNPKNPNQIVIGWRQFDNVSSNFRQAGCSYSSDAGAGWTFPGVLIEPGVFRSDPVLDYDSTGNFYYNSLTNSFTCKVFTSSNGGASWNAGANAGGGDKQWMAIDRTKGVGSGNIYSFWTSSYSTCLPGYFTRSTNGASSFENCTVASDSSYWGTMAVGNNGELYIAGVDTNGNMEVMKSLNAQIPASVITWNPPVSVNLNGFFSFGGTINPEGLLGQANIDVDRSSGPGSGNVYVVASMTPTSSADPGDVMFAKSTDGGLTWSSPERINDDISTTNTQWLSTMSVAPNGRIDIVWLDTRNAPSGSDSSALYYSYSTDQGTTWSANERLSGLFNPHVGYPNQNKMGDYFDMISDNTGAHLAWANTFNGEEDVYYSRIIPQTGNGINDVFNNASFLISPNPTNGKFQLQSTDSKLQIDKIEIYNVMGEKVFSEITNDKQETINLNDASGIYFLKIITVDGRTIVKKIIRE